VEHQRNVCAMAKQPKVVPIREDAGEIIAKDEKTSRFILNVGTDRVAFDFLTRITKLPPKTGDQPAAVLPLVEKPKRKRS
jgi:hypothetical protein